jgi:cell division protein DivIC
LHSEKFLPNFALGFFHHTWSMALPSNPWQALWQRLPTPLQNRYYLTLLVFFFLLIFLDKHSLWTQWRLHRAQQRLEADRAYYEQKILEAKEEAADFELTKEKFAREHYYMKRANEDVYIIQEEK